MAAAICYSGSHTYEEVRKKAEERPAEYLSKIVKNGHLSILEHNIYVFYVSGLSRVASHQLVRKRIASYSQQSQRYVSAENFKAIIPETIKDSGFIDDYNQKLEECGNLYQKMVDGGVPKEDARFILPGATTTQLIVSMNAHSLIDFFVQRLCVRSQWEIRQLAELMLDEVRKVSPLIFKDLGAYCDFYGYCPENDKSCGRIPTLNEIKNV